MSVIRSVGRSGVGAGVDGMGTCCICEKSLGESPGWGIEVIWGGLLKFPPPFMPPLPFMLLFMLFPLSRF